MPALHPSLPRRAARALLLASLAATALISGGCQEPLFTEDQPRSQFDRFDAVRDRRAPQYYFDEFGNRRPNLRARLLQTDE